MNDLNKLNDLKLIQCVRAHECLYDLSTKENRKNNARLAAWNQVAEEMNSTAYEVKNHWMKLRNAFLHALLRRKKPGGSTISKWRYADEMSFVLPFFTQRPHRPGQRLRRKKTLDNSSFQNDANSEDTDEDRASQASSESTNPQDIAEDDQDIAQDDDQDKTDISESALLIEVIKHFDKQNKKDEIDLFFECMAKTVKQFPKLEQIRVQRQIFECVNAVEFKLLNADPLQRAQNGFGIEAEDQKY